MTTIGGCGYAAPLWPKEYGGLSAEPWTLQLVREELDRYRLPTVSANILGVGLAGPTIIAHGTDAQKERYLKRILTGEDIWCQLFSEPGAGSDLASLGTRACATATSGSINGQKVWTSIAQFARYGMLLARTDPDKPKHDGLTYFIARHAGAGVEIRPLRQITGSAEFNEVYFTDVRIPDADRSVMWATAGGGPHDADERAGRARRRDPRPRRVMGGTREDSRGSRSSTIPPTADPGPPAAGPLLHRAAGQGDHRLPRHAARLAGQEPGPEGSVNKVFNAEFNQRRSDSRSTPSACGGGLGAGRRRSRGVRPRLAAGSGQHDRGRDQRDPAQPDRRAGARPAPRAPGGQGVGVEGDPP